jgi:hypothetical protein
MPAKLPRTDRADGSPAAERQPEAERWRTGRRELIRHRHEITGLAARLYPDAATIDGTALLSRPDWQPAEPLDLDQVTLRWRDAGPPAVDGTGPETEPLRPVRPDGGRYRGYADALGALSPPALFENRTCYRMLAADLSPAPRLDLTGCRYFDVVNIGEALAHELADAWRADPAVTLSRLPLRSAVGDPFDLARRCAVPAIATLTLRRTAAGEASFLVHWRDPAKVTHAGGTYQVAPVGVFQPADDSKAAERADLSLWRCMAREFSEELLGTSEDYGGRLEYERWPFFRRLTDARQAGGLAVYFLGVGVDPVSLALDILTVAVFDHKIFDSILNALPPVNAEGRLVSRAGSRGIPFTRDCVVEFTSGGSPMQPAGAALLRLAWRYRALLL